jgi:hypothetical protein
MSYEIKPLSVGEIVDGAFQLYRNHFAVFSGVAVALAVPTVIGTALVTWAVMGTFVLVPGTHPGDLPRFWLAWSIAMPLIFGSYVLQHSVLTIAIADAYLGKAVSIEAAFRRAIQHFGSLVGAAVLSFLGIWGGFMLLVVPGILLMLRWLFTVQAIVVEGAGASASLKRSKQLTLGRRGRLAGLLLILTVINIAIQYGAAAAIPNAVLTIPVIGAIIKGLPGMLLAPIYPGIVTLAYFDARVRTEAFDLEMLSRTIGGATPAVGPVPARVL